MRHSGVAFDVVVIAASAHADNGGPSKPHKLHRVWTGLTFGFTTVFHPSSGNDVCIESNWACAQSDAGFLLGIRFGFYFHPANVIAPLKTAAAFGSGSTIAYMPEVALLGSAF